MSRRRHRSEGHPHHIEFHKDSGRHARSGGAARTHMNAILHRAPVIDQAHPVLPLPPMDRAEGRTIPPTTMPFSREELRLIVLDIMG